MTEIVVNMNGKSDQLLLCVTFKENLAIWSIKFVVGAGAGWFIGLL
jgi:hypothetical protein